MKDRRLEQLATLTPFPIIIGSAAKRLPVPMAEPALRAKMRRVILFFSLSLGILGGGWSPRSQNEPPKLPALPHILPDEFPSPIRDKVRKSYAAEQAHPESAEANGELGMLLEAANKSDERAEICYLRAHTLDPSSYRWAYYLGVLRANRGNPGGAVEAFRETLRLEPSYLPAQSRLAESLRESGSVKEAIKIFEAVVEHNPADAQARYDLGQAYRSDNDLNTAVESFRKACELFPNFGAAHYALAHLYERLNHSELASKELNLYEKNRYDIPGVNDPLLAAVTELYINPESLVQSGIEYANQGKLEKAVAEEEKALQIDPKLFKAHVNLISFYGRLHEFAKAEDHYQLARKINPASPESYHNFGVLLAEEGKFGEAEDQFRRAIEMDPGHAEALTSLGLLLERRGRQQEAMEDYRKAIAAKPEYRQAHFNLGRILVNQKIYSEGIQELLKTLTPVDETTPTYLYALGAAYGRAEDKQNALKYLREAQAQASIRGQTGLLSNIERDLHTVESE